MPTLRAARTAALFVALFGASPTSAADAQRPDWLPNAPSPDADALPPGAVARLGSLRFQHADAVKAVAVSDDGRTIASASRDCLILWDAATGRERRRYRSVARPENEVQMAGGGNVVAAVNATREMRLIDLATGRYTAVTLPGAGTFSAVAVSPDGAAVASVRSRTGAEAGEQEGAWHCRITLWDARGRKLRELDNGWWGVRAVALSAGGKRLADLRSDGRVHLWDAETGRELKSFPAGPASADDVDLALSPAGDCVALNVRNGDEEAIVVREAETGKERWQWKPKPGVNAMTFSPDGKTLAVATASGIRLLQATDGTEVRRLGESVAEAVSLAFSRDGKTLVAGGADGRVRLWDVAAGRERLQPVGHTYRATALVFSPDGRLLASGDGRGTVCLWDVSAARELHRLAVGPGIVGLAFAPDGGRLSVNAGRSVSLWDNTTGRKHIAVDAGQPGLPSMAFTPGGRSLACVSRDALVWLNADTLAVEKKLPGVATAISRAVTVATLRSGGVLVCANNKPGGAVVHDQAGKEVARPSWFLVNSPSSIAVAPTGRHLALCLGPGCTLWDLASDSAAYRWEMESDQGTSWDAAFSADGRLLAMSVGERGAWVFEVASRRQITGFVGNPGGSGAIAFAPDGRTLATADDFGTILLWDLARPRVGEKLVAPSAAELASLWGDLLGEDARRAYRAVWRLADAPGQGVPFLHERLKPAAALAAARVRALVADLDDRRFATRRAAFRELSEAGELAEAELRHAARAEHSAETREALAKLLKNLEAQRSGTSGEALRTVRAVQALDYMRTPESRELLERLAGGASGATLTREARAALGRARP